MRISGGSGLAVWGGGDMHLFRRRLFVWPFGRYKFRARGGGRSTLRAKGGQTFVVDVHALTRHGYGIGSQLLGVERTGNCRQSGRQTGR